MAVSSEFNATGKATGTASRLRGAHRGTAFLVEALVVLALLMASLSVFVRLFTSAQLVGLNATQASQAVLLATNKAEEFAADPTGVEKTTSQDGFTTTCEVTETRRTAGTLYDATITVSDERGELYELHTARYVSDANGGA